MDILKQGGGAEVISPPSLREQISAEIAAMAAHYLD